MRYKEEDMVYLKSTISNYAAKITSINHNTKTYGIQIYEKESKQVVSKEVREEDIDQLALVCDSDLPGEKSEDDGGVEDSI